jgi:carbonic anhydrase/acetyltransferase-like protein (isoleucine patch superfamily)
MTMKKYEFTGETKRVELWNRTATLHRIKATVEFGFVKVGELGGWIEKEENLSHEGKAWVCGNAEVCGDAKVWGNAEVCGDAKVCGNAEVCGDAKVWGNAKVCGDAEVCGNAEVCGDAKVCGNAKVCGDAEVCGDAKVCGDAEVCGDANVCGDAEVFLASHVLVMGSVGSRNDFTTFFRDKDNEITVKCGCFLGKIDKFLEKVTQTHGNNKYALVYRAAVEVAKLQIELTERK